MTVQEAVRKLDLSPCGRAVAAGSRPARPGAFADVVIFDPATFQDHSTYEKPMQYATGVTDVFINGLLALKRRRADRGTPPGAHCAAAPGRARGWRPSGRPPRTGPGSISRRANRSAGPRTRVLMQVANERGTGEKLPRVLGGGALVLLGVGATIGTGDLGAHRHRGRERGRPGRGGVFRLCGGGRRTRRALLRGARLSISGGRERLLLLAGAFGEAASWFVGWTLVLEYLLAAATVAVGWSAYNVVSLLKGFGLHLPESLTAAPLTPSDSTWTWVRNGAYLNLPAVVSVVGMTTICALGIRVSAVFNAIIVTIKVLVIVLVIAFGLGYVDPANWVPFVPPNTGRFGQFGWSGVLRGAAIVFYAYVGFDAVSTAAQEARNPERDMRVGILGSLAVCAVLYVLVAAVVTGMARYPTLDTPAPVAAVLDLHPRLAWLTSSAEVGALDGPASAMLMMILAQSRILFPWRATDSCLGPWVACIRAFRLLH